MPIKVKDPTLKTVESQRARFESVSNAFEARLHDYELKGLGGLLAVWLLGLPSVWLYVRATAEQDAWTFAAVVAALQIAYLLSKRFILSRETAHLRHLYHDLTATGTTILLANHTRGREAQLTRFPPDGSEDRVVTPERLASVRSYGRFLHRTEL
jgi:hypothetical protein